MNNPLVSNVRNPTARLRRVLWYYAASVVPLLCFVPSASAQSVDHVRNIEKAKKTIAPVVCLVKSMKTDKATTEGLVRFRIMGTAFMVDAEGTFITAKHVVDEFDNAPWNDTCLPAITFPVGGWRRAAVEVRWFAFVKGQCQMNARWDVAVCRTVTNLSKKTEITYEVAKISAERPPDGTSVFFTGFPLQATDPVTSIGAIAGFAASDNYNTVSIDKNAWPGASGSPIFLSTGDYAIGMLTRTGAGQAAGITYGVAGEIVLSVLSAARANWAKEANQQPEKK